MADKFDWTVAATAASADLKRYSAIPIVPTWSRLEPLPLTTGDLTPGVQALVADPLWMLGRQWQFDELRGEDAGTPVRATVRGETAPFTRFHPGAPIEGNAADNSVDIDVQGSVNATPLEVRVEAETPAVLPLRLRTQMGLHLLRLLRAGGFGAVANAASGTFPVPDEPLPAPSAPPPPADPAGAARRRLAAGRVPDGVVVLNALAAHVDGAGEVTTLPDALVASAGARDVDVRAVLSTWRRWASSMLAMSTGVSWNPHRLEHAFLAQALLSDGPVTMRVDEYPGGSLDWFHGELVNGLDLGRATAPPSLDVPSPTTGAPSSASAAAKPIADTTLPTPVRFAGMANDRLFAFEDAAVYLGGLQAGRTDLARLAVVEFSLAYSVDWFNVPLVLPYGSATRIDTVEVVDTFGVTVDVAPAREATSPGWSAFQSTPITDSTRLANVFVLAPTVPRVLEGTPLEEVVLFRDEMANLVWGVERTVPSRYSGEPIPRAQQAARVSLRQSIPDDLGDAQIIYRLMTPVPENWMPFVAVRDRPNDLTAHHKLERRPMLRYHEDGTAELVNPLGTLLLTAPGADPATDRLQIAEEEVPREGVVVTRAFRQARTENGATVLWIGRRARVGRGEGSSGLRFDTALAPGAV